MAVTSSSAVRPEKYRSWSVHLIQRKTLSGHSDLKLPGLVTCFQKGLRSNLLKLPRK
jgi:hypothetical protein